MSVGIFTSIIHSIRDGIGMDEDTKRDWDWAQEGDVNAQVRLAYRYLRGDGLCQDNDQALRWFSKAACNGSELADQELKKLSSMGIY